MGGFTGGHEPVREDEHTRTHKHTHTQILKCQQTNQQTQDTHTQVRQVCVLSVCSTFLSESVTTLQRGLTLLFFSTLSERSVIRASFAHEMMQRRPSDVFVQRHRVHTSVSIHQLSVQELEADETSYFNLII